MAEPESQAEQENVEQSNSQMREGQFTEKYAAFLSQHKQNKEKLKADTTRFVEQTAEVVRNVYMDKLQDMDTQLQSLICEKEQIQSAKSRHEIEVLERADLPDLDDLEKDFHTVLKMRKIATDKVEDLSGAMSPSKKSKGEELIGNLDGILAKRALLVDKISSFSEHMAGLDSLEMTAELHAQLDDIYKSKAELASDMRIYSEKPSAPFLGDLQDRLNDIYKEKEEVFVEKIQDQDHEQSVVPLPAPQRVSPDDEEAGGEKEETKHAADENGGKDGEENAEFPIAFGDECEAEVAEEEEETEKLVWKRTVWPKKIENPVRKAAEKMAQNKGAEEQEEGDDKQADDMKVIREATKSDFSPPLPAAPPPEVPSGSKEEADAVLFSELKRLVDLLQERARADPEAAGEAEPLSRSSNDNDRSVDEVVSLAQYLQSKIDDLQKAVNDVGSARATGARSQGSESLSAQIAEKRQEVSRIQEFAGLCKQHRLAEAEAFLPIVQAKMGILKSDISALESKTIEMQTAIEDTGISQPVPDVSIPIHTLSSPESAREVPPQPVSLLAAKLRVREALDNVACSAIAFCAFGIAVFVLGVFAPVAFPCWGPALCLATIGAFYSYTKANGIDTPVYPRLFRNGAMLACVLLVASAILSGLAFLSINGLRGTPACSSAVLYSPQCGDPVQDPDAASGAQAAPKCFNDLTLAEYERRLKGCEALRMCADGKVKLAPCDVMVAVNGFGALFSLSLAVTVVCISLWVFFHLETRIREYHVLEERRASGGGFADSFAPLSTGMCLAFFGCRCCARCGPRQAPVSDDLIDARLV